MPELEALGFRALGRFDGTIIDLQLLALAFGLLGAMWSLSRGRARSIVVGVAALAVVTAPQFLLQLGTNYVDIPLAVFVAATLLAAARWLSGDEDELGSLVCFAVFGGTAAMLKNEGTMFAVAAIVALLLATLPAGKAQLRRAALASAGVLAIALPWRLYGAGYDLPTADYDLRNLFDPRYLADHADRVGPVVRELVSELTDVGRWGLLPAACALALVAGLLAARRTVGVFAAAWAVLAFCGLVLTYWLSVLPLASDLSNSSYRTVASIVIGISCLVPLLVDDGVTAGVRMLARARARTLFDPRRSPMRVLQFGSTVPVDGGFRMLGLRKLMPMLVVAALAALGLTSGTSAAPASTGWDRQRLRSRLDRRREERHLPQGEVGHARLRPTYRCVALGPAASRDDDASPRLPLRPREPGQAGRHLFDGGRGEERALDRGRIGSRIGKPRGCLPCSPSGDTPRSATRPLVGSCARHDSNVRPQPPQGCALSPELRAREGECSCAARREPSRSTASAGTSRRTYASASTAPLRSRPRS